MLLSILVNVILPIEILKDSTDHTNQDFEIKFKIHLYKND